MVYWLAIASPSIAIIIIDLLMWREQMQQREAEEKYWSPSNQRQAAPRAGLTLNSFDGAEDVVLQQMLTTIRARLADLRSLDPGPARRCCSD